MSLDPKEKTAAMQLFELKKLLRDKILECEKTAEAVTSVQTRRWYRFMGSEIEKILRQIDGLKAVDERN